MDNSGYHIDFSVQAIDIVKELPETEGVRERMAIKLAYHFLYHFTYRPKEIVRLSEFIKDRDSLANEAINYYRKSYSDGTVNDLQLHSYLHQISFVFSNENKKKKLLEEALLFMLNNCHIDYAVNIAKDLKGRLDDNETQFLLQLSDLDRAETFTHYFKRGLRVKEILILALNSLEKIKKREERESIYSADVGYKSLIEQTLPFFQKPSEEKIFFYDKFLSLCVEKGVLESAVMISNILGKKLSRKELEHLLEKTLEGEETGYAKEVLAMLSKTDRLETISKRSFWKRIFRR